MSARAEQLVLEYLSRVADAAQGVLRSDERTRFVTRLRYAIEAERRAAGAVEPAAVRRVLARFGDPKALVERERARRDAPAGPAEGTQSSGSTDPVAPSAPGASKVPGAVGRAAVRRPWIRSAESTGTTGTTGTTGSASAAVPGSAGPGAVRRPLVRPAGPGRPAGPAASAGTAGSGRSGRSVVPRRRGVWVGTADRGGRPPRDGAGQGPPATSAEPPTTASPEHSWTRQNPLAGQQYGVDPVALARRFPWEVFALVALGPGGLVLPFPLWLIGAVAALTSKAAWSRGDRLIGLGGPPLVTVVGIALIGALNKNPSITVDVHAYVAAAHADGGLLFRIGAAVGACYLGVRLVRAYRAATAKGRSASGQP